MSDLTLQQALDRDPGYRTTAENLMADRIEELEAANALLLDKWERQECSWCGTNQALAPSRY